MNRAKRISTLVLLTVLTAAQILAHRVADCLTPVEVTEIKNLGISDSDETKSVIEVQWQLNPALHPNHSDFNVSLEITYANGTILLVDERSENTARSAQIEIPTISLRRGKAPAFIKQIKALVTTEVVSKREIEK